MAGEGDLSREGSANGDNLKLRYNVSASQYGETSYLQYGSQILF